MEDTKLIVKANALIESKYKLSVREQKIILYLISQIKKDDEDFKTYTLPIRKFSEILDLKGEPKYSELKAVTKELMSKVLEIREGDKIHQVTWLSHVVYNVNEGTIDMKFTPFLKPYLLQLKKEFTSYKMINIVNLNSKYSIRLYELLKQYQNVKERIFILENLRETLEIGKMYPRYSNFKQKIIIPSIEDINTKTDLNVSFEETKQGKSVKKITFYIKNQLVKEKNEITPFDDVLEERNYPLYDQINEITKKYSYTVDIKTVKRWEHLAKEKWEDNKNANLLFLINEVNQLKEIENPIGYITSILQSTNPVNKVVRKELKPNWIKKENIFSEIKSTEEEQRQLKELISKYKK